MTKHLCERVQRAVEFLAREDIFVKTLVVSGGVASNAYIRQVRSENSERDIHDNVQGLTKVAGHYQMEAVFPPPALCTDNGVMIAWNGLERWRAGRGVVAWDKVLEVGVDTRVPLGEDWHHRVEEAAIKCKWIKL